MAILRKNMAQQTVKLHSGPHRGSVIPPPSKSHLHRLLIADFLGGSVIRLTDSNSDSEDILATKRCLRALASNNQNPVLDCGESGSTLRFMKPIAAALGKKPKYVMRGRLAERPGIDYDTIFPGLHELSGNISSQFATGLLFALPLLKSDSEIRFTTPIESRGYLDLTLEVLKDSGINIKLTENGFIVPGNQKYKAPLQISPEADWSGAAFWLAMNALGSCVEVNGLNPQSAQPDRKIIGLLSQTGGDKDMSQCPDIFPVLAIVAGTQSATTRFTGVKRLRIKESNRITSVTDMLTNLGVKTSEEEDIFTVFGNGGLPYPGNVSLKSFGDHRIAMSAAVAATYANGPVYIDNTSCAAKSYPEFFSEFARTLDSFTN